MGRLRVPAPFYRIPTRAESGRLLLLDDGLSSFPSCRVPHTTRFSLCGLMGSFSAESFGPRFDQLSPPTQAKTGLEWATAQFASPAEVLPSRK